MVKTIIKINDYLAIAIKNAINGNDVIVIRKNNPNLILKLRHGKKK